VNKSEKVIHLLKPYPEEEMVVYPVGFGVNSPKNDGERLIRRLDDAN
jgi:putative SOS response-associated peptidase YedK